MKVKKHLNGRVKILNIVQLKTFCSVARTLSFTASAAELAISQPAVSRQISSLEEEIGTKLFAREHNTLFMTPAGLLLYEKLPEKLDELETLFFSTHLLGIGKNRRLKLGVLCDQILDKHLIEIMRCMRDENYFMTIQSYDFIGLERALENHDIDVAVCLKWVKSAFSGCKKFKIGEQKLCLAVNRDYTPEIPTILDRTSLGAFSKIRPVMVPEISSYPRRQRIEVTEHMAMLWQNIMEEATSCIVPMVQTGIGSALVNEQHVLSLEASVEMIPIDFLKPMEMDAFWIEDSVNQSIPDFIGRLKAACQAG